MLLIILIFSTAGVYTCRSIIMYLLNKDSALATRLCKTKGKYNCDKVLGSGLVKISSNIHLGDVGLVYFISQILFILFEVINGKAVEALLVLSLPFLFAFALTFVSLLYQAFLIKSWCKMCLIILAIIWVQEALVTVGVFIKGRSSYDFLSLNTSIVKLLPSILTFATSISVSSAWFFVKPVIVTANEVKTIRKRLSLWKNNAQIFMMLLKTQRKVNNESWENDFFLGSREAAIQVITAVNPYCIPCSKEYKSIMDFLKLFPRSIGFTIRFVVHGDKESKSNLAVQYLLHQYVSAHKDAQPKILENWFDSMIIEEWEKSSSNTGLIKGELLGLHQQWFEKSQIEYTPTTFVNGYEFPQPYVFEDLKKLIKPLRKMIAEETQTKKITAE